MDKTIQSGDLIVADIMCFNNVEVTGIVYEKQSVLCVEGYPLGNYSIKEVYRKDHSNNYKRIYNFNRGEHNLDKYSEQCDKCKTCRHCKKKPSLSDAKYINYSCTLNDDRSIIQFCGYEKECPKYEES